MIRKAYLFALMFFMFAASVDAAILYVDKDNACNGDGSTGNPYCSIQLAVTNVNAGDTIRIRDAASAYSEAITTTKTGTSDSVRITVEPDTGHNPTIHNAGAGGSCATFYLQGGAYWTFQNLNFDATGVNPCKFGAILAQSGFAGGNTQSVKILNNTFKGWGGPTGEPSTTAMNAVIISGGISGPLEGTWPTNTVVEGNVFDSNRTYSLVLSHTDGTIVRNNEFVNQKCGRGQDSVNQVAMHVIFTNKNLLITENEFHDFDLWSNCTSLTDQGFSTEAAIWCDVGQWETGVVTNNEISRNQFYNINAAKTNYSNPNGLSHASRALFIEQRCAGFTVKNNIIRDIGAVGITNAYHSLDASQPPNLYYNNTIYSVGLMGFLIKTGVAEVRNNIFSENGMQICRGSCGEDGNTANVTLTADYNLYDDNGSQTLIGQVSGTTYNLADWRTNCSCGDANSITGDPLFTNTGAANFSLQSGSPARNAGETIASVTNDYANVSRPQGAAYDTGALEFDEDTGGGSSGGGTLELRIIRSL